MEHSAIARARVAPTRRHMVTSDLAVDLAVTFDT